jgi:hypothetical protein
MAFYFNITFVKKYLYGFTSEKEEAELLNNFEINGKMAEVWDNFSDLKSREIHPDTDKIFQVIRTQANIPDKQIYRLNSQDAKRKWYNHNLAIAASLIFMMLLGTIAFYVYQKYDLNSYITVVSEKGQRKEFTLPDGSRVW